MARAGCCSCCKRHVEKKGHSATCRLKDRPVPRRVHEAGAERLYFTVDPRPLNATAYSLLAELHESFGGES